MDESVMSESGEHASQARRDEEGGLCSLLSAGCQGLRDVEQTQIGQRAEGSEQTHTGQQADRSEQRPEVTASGADLFARGDSSLARKIENEKSLGEMDSEEVARWVRQVLTQADSPSVHSCLEGVVQVFRANMVTGVDVLELTSEDLREELGISTLAVRKALMQAIKVHLAR